MVIVFFFSDVLIVLLLGKQERYYWFGCGRSACSSSGDSMFLWRITVLSVHRGFRPFPDPQNMVGHSFRLHAFVGGMGFQGRVMCVTHSNVVCKYQKRRWWWLWTGLTYIWWYSCRLKKRIHSKASGRPSNHQLKFAIQRCPFTWWKHWVVTLVVAQLKHWWSGDEQQGHWFTTRTRCSDRKQLSRHFPHRSWSNNVTQDNTLRNGQVKNKFPSRQLFTLWLLVTDWWYSWVWVRLLYCWAQKTPPLKKVFFKNARVQIGIKFYLRKTFL